MMKPDFTLTYDDIDAIADSTAPKWDDKRKIDALLEIACTIMANTGIDSTRSELRTAKAMTKEVYKRVKKVDKLLGEQLLHYNV